MKMLLGDIGFIIMNLELHKRRVFTNNMNTIGGVFAGLANAP